MSRNQKELAAYLARARGPGETSMKFTPRPRPTGEAARAVWKIYDLPLNPDSGIGTKYNDNDGTDWALGQTSKLGELPHDGGMGLDGNLYYTVNNPNRLVTIGKVDGKTGDGFVSQGGRAKRRGGHRSRPDARRAGKLLVRRESGSPRPRQARPEDRQDHRVPDPLGHDARRRRRDDGRRRPGKDLGIVARRRAAVRPGNRNVHGIPLRDVPRARRAPSRRMALQAIATATAGGRRWRLTPSAWRTSRPARCPRSSSRRSRPKWIALRRIVRSTKGFSDAGFSVPIPWSLGPRRMGTDKNADVLWVGNSWGASLTRINTKTRETTIIPLPSPALQAYHIAVDGRHNAWGNLWTADQLFKYDPAANRFTLFDLPVHGTEIRHISLLERDGSVQVDRADLPFEPDGRDDGAQRDGADGSEVAGAIAALRARRRQPAARSFHSCSLRRVQKGTGLPGFGRSSL